MSGAVIERLHAYVEALRPVLYIPHFDFGEVTHWIEAVAGQRRVYHFTGAASYYTEGAGPHQERPQTKLPEFLAALLVQPPAELFVVIHDCHLFWKDPEAIGWIKALIARTLADEGFRATIFLLSASLEIPPELEEYITVVEVPQPTAGETRALVDEFCRIQGVTLDAAIAERITASLRGLHRYQMLQLLTMAYQRTGTIDSAGTRLLMHEKEQLIKKSGLIELLHVTERIEDIGGLDNLKQWLYNKARIFKALDQAIKARVEPPRGILIVGMPGCGKSLTAKATAALFEVPLLRLDMGKLLGKYVGESEANMRRALKVAEAVSPCVLWIDELEKAFAGVGESGGGNDVTTRLFGYFLTWMQEKSSPVFVVATANDISKLPPEFLRRGRFDELFAVTFPTVDERRQILEIHLSKRDRFRYDLDMGELLRRMEDFSGADIEAVVKQAVENAFLAGRHALTTAGLLAVIKETTSLKVTMKERVAQLEELLKRYQFKPASREAAKVADADEPHWSVRELQGDGNEFRPAWPAAPAPGTENGKLGDAFARFSAAIQPPGLHKRSSYSVYLRKVPGEKWSEVLGVLRAEGIDPDHDRMMGACPIKGQVSEAYARKLEASLVAAGAKVEVRPE